jgi:hypothetical protein
LTLQQNHSHCGSRFFAHIDVEEIFLKNSEVYVISLISDEYGLYFISKSGVQGFKVSRQGFAVRGALRFRFEAKKDRTILASNLRPLSSKQP